MSHHPHCCGPYLSLTVKAACKTCGGSHVPYLTLTIHNDRVFLLYCCAKFSLAVLPVASRDRCWRSTTISQQPSEHRGIKFTKMQGIPVWLRQISMSRDWQTIKAAAEFEGPVLLKFGLLTLSHNNTWPSLCSSFPSFACFVLFPPTTVCARSTLRGHRGHQSLATVPNVEGASKQMSFCRIFFIPESKWVLVGFYFFWTN